MPNVATIANAAAPTSDISHRDRTNQKQPLAARPMNSAFASLNTMTFAGNAGNNHQRSASTAG
jgi:hypothetical protein